MLSGSSFQNLGVSLSKKLVPNTLATEGEIKMCPTLRSLSGTFIFNLISAFIICHILIFHISDHSSMCINCVKCFCSQESFGQLQTKIKDFCCLF